MADPEEIPPNPHGSVTTHNEQNQHGSLLTPCNVSTDPLPRDNCNAEQNNNRDDHNIMIDEENEEYFRSFPAGYYFCPTDYELIVHYLSKKIKHEKLPRNRIRDVNLYRYSPDQISEMYQGLGGKEWYFFTPRDRKYSNGTRPNRAAGTGYWKATGADKAIRHNCATIGFRKALVFYEGKPPKGEKTNWIMHEYRVNAEPRKKSSATDMRLDDYVLCRIYKKTDKSFKGRQRNADDQNDQNDHLYQTPSPTYQNVEAGSVSLYDKDEHMEDYRDYPQPVLHNEVLQMPPLQPDIPENSNPFQSFDYGYGQTPVGFPMPFINPTTSRWDSRPRVMPVPPVYSTANNVYRSGYLKEGAWEFRPRGMQEEQMWDKAQKDLLAPDFDDIHNLCFADPEINLDTILNSNPPSNPSEGPSMPKRESD